MLYKQATAVSIIHDRENEPSNVISYNLGSCGHGAQVIPSVPGYTYFNGKVTNTVFSRRLEKGTRSVRELLGILGTTGSAVPHDFSSAVTQNNAKILPCGFISCPQTLDEKKTSEMTNVFTGVEFGYQNGFSSSQYIETRLFASAANTTAGSSQFSTIYINTGMCMFSRTTLASATERDMFKPLEANDSAIAPLPINLEPTMYELEIIARLSTTIADILGRLAHCNAKILVNIDIPDFQYYWKACTLFQKGLVDVDYVQGWIGPMDSRRRRLGIVLTTMIYSAMRRRGVSDSNVSIQLNSGTEEAALVFKMNIAAGEVPILEEVIKSLTSRGPEASKWKMFLDSLRLQDQPKTIDELGKLVYVFKTVKTALSTEESTDIPSEDFTNNIGRSLIVQVNDITDWRIFDKSKMFLKKYSKLPAVSKIEFTIIGIFPLQRIFLAGPGRSNLYEHRSSSRYVSKKSDLAPIRPTQIIGRVYGTDLAFKLRDSFLKRRDTRQIFLNDLVNNLFRTCTKWQEQSEMSLCTYSFMGVLRSFLRNWLTQSRIKNHLGILWSTAPSISALFDEICAGTQPRTDYVGRKSPAEQKCSS